MESYSESDDEKTHHRSENGQYKYLKNLNSINAFLLSLVI